MKCWLIPCAALLLVAPLAPRTASATCGVDGTITATLTQPGEWTYCIQFSYYGYSLDDTLTRVSLFMPRCQVGCRADLVTFPVPAGTLSGVTAAGDSCAVDLAGHFYCAGDPALNAPPVPTVSWSPTNADLCHPTLPVTGEICFTLDVPPSEPREQTNAVTVLSAGGQCWGTLKGVFPDCNPPVPTRGITWSALKGTRYSH